MPGNPGRVGRRTRVTACQRTSIEVSIGQVAAQARRPSKPTGLGRIGDLPERSRYPVRLDNDWTTTPYRIGLTPFELGLYNEIG